MARKCSVDNLTEVTYSWASNPSKTYTIEEFEPQFIERLKAVGRYYDGQADKLDDEECRAILT